MKQSFLLFFALLSLVLTACTQPRVQAPKTAQEQTLNPLQSTTYMESHDKVVKTEEEWKNELTQEQYYVCRQAGTERPFANAYWDNHEKGTYYCVACGQALFKSDTKYESGSGWPSFFAPFSKEALIIKVDRSHGMVREEVECSKCHSHLGHVFPDGPKPTGLRYCMNSAAMKFTKEE